MKKTRITTRIDRFAHAISLSLRSPMERGCLFKTRRFYPIFFSIWLAGKPVSCRRAKINLGDFGVNQTYSLFCLVWWHDSQRNLVCRNFAMPGRVGQGTEQLLAKTKGIPAVQNSVGCVSCGECVFAGFSQNCECCLVYGNIEEQ